MEPTLTPSSGPSKTFLIRGGIALGIVAIILIAQSSWVRSLFTKEGSTKKSGISVKDKTLSEVVGADSNGNGIADWEERLWGLDPTVAFTDGVSNKQIIEEKRASLASGSDTGPLTETDRIARSLYSATTALTQSGGVDDGTLASLGQKVADSVKLEQIKVTYTNTNLKTTQTTRTNLTNYYNAMSAISAKYQNLPDMEVVIAGLESQDFTEVRALGSAAGQYKQYAREMIALSVPIGVAEHHLAMANSLAGIGDAFERISEIEDDAIVGTQGINLYQQHIIKFQRALFEMEQYLQKYGILST